MRLRVDAPVVPQMTLRECTCGTDADHESRFPPNPRVNPGREDFCVRCSYWINPAWTCNAKTIDAFLDRLEEALPGEDLTAFREHVVVRELAGRERFGHSFLLRNNLAEALEEGTDFVLYLLLDALKRLRENGESDDYDLTLTAAAQVFKGYEAVRYLMDKRRSGTGPGWDE